MTEINNPWPVGPLVWSEAEWDAFERDTRRRALRDANPAAAWSRIVRASRKVMRSYTTSFFIVSRFLPRRKRDKGKSGGRCQKKSKHRRSHFAEALFSSRGSGMRR